MNAAMEVPSKDTRHFALAADMSIVVLVAHKRSVLVRVCTCHGGARAEREP
ncbi:MAG: hypothetical protein PVI01_07660 [Gemmatimonadales bacterium]